MPPLDCSQQLIRKPAAIKLIEGNLDNVLALFHRALAATNGSDVQYGVAVQRGRDTLATGLDAGYWMIWRRGAGEA